MHDRKAVSAKKLTQPRPHEGRVGRSADIFSVMSPGRRSSIEKHKKYMLIHELRSTARGHEKTFVRTTFVRPDRTPVWPENEPAWFDRASVWSGRALGVAGEQAGGGVGKWKGGWVGRKGEGEGGTPKVVAGEG